ncbi:MAG: hypothetical protein P8Y47_08390, partial [Alphaproteobacteria bacterium]
LTRRTLLATLKYPVAYSNFPQRSSKEEPRKCYYDSENDIMEWAFKIFPEDRELLKSVEQDVPKYRTFDASLIELADDISYAVHDIEDIIGRGIVDKDHFKKAIKKSFTPIRLTPIPTTS